MLFNPFRVFQYVKITSEVTTICSRNYENVKEYVHNS